MAQGSAAAGGKVVFLETAAHLKELHHAGIGLSVGDAATGQAVDNLTAQVASHRGTGDQIRLGSSVHHYPLVERVGEFIRLRLAGIRSEQGETEEAVFLLLNAKDFMAERLSYEPFWGHIEVMGRIVRFLYKLIPFDEEDADFYDMFYLTQTPGRYEMTRAGETVTIEVTEENGERAIGYDGKFFRSFEDFCSKAEHNGAKFTAVYDEFYNCRTM